MQTHADKAADNKSQPITGGLSQQADGQFVDNRAEAVAQRKLKDMANNGPQAMQLKAYQDMANSSPQVAQLKAYHDLVNGGSLQSKPLQSKIVQRTVVDDGGKSIDIDTFITTYVEPLYAGLGVAADDTAAVTADIKPKLARFFAPDEDGDNPNTLEEIKSFFKDGELGNFYITTAHGALKASNKPATAAAESAAAPAGAHVTEEPVTASAAAAAGAIEEPATASAAAAAGGAIASSEAQQKVAAEAAGAAAEEPTAAELAGGAIASSEAPHKAAAAAGAGTGAHHKESAAGAPVKSAAATGPGDPNAIGTDMFESLGGGKYGSTKEILAQDVYDLAVKSVEKNVKLTVLSGTHGDDHGWLFGETDFANKDLLALAPFGIIVHNVNGKSKDAIRAMIDGATTPAVVLAWCFSKVSYENWDEIHAVFTKRAAFEEINTKARLLYNESRELAASNKQEDKDKYAPIEAEIGRLVAELQTLKDW